MSPERLKELRGLLNLSQKSLGERIGVSQSNYAGMESGTRPIGKRISNDIVKAFNLNTSWWENGEGPVFLPESTKAGQSPILIEESKQLKQMKEAPNLYVPFYDVDVTAGRFELFEDFQEIPSGYIYAPEFTGCVSCRVKGDSMYDRIYPGATAFIYYIANKKYIDYGQIYLIVLDGYRVLKYVRAHSDPGKVCLVSQNKNYQDWEVDKADILHMFLVKGYWNQTSN